MLLCFSAVPAVFLVYIKTHGTQVINFFNTEDLN